MAKPKRTRADDPITWDRSVSSDIEIIQNIISTQILAQYNRGNRNAQTLALCAFTQVLVCLKDLLTKASNEGLRLDEKINKVSDLDITDLITKMRDAACHLDSKDNLLGKSTWRFNMETLPNGDIVYTYGSFGIAYHGSLLLAFAEVKKRLIPLTELSPEHFE